MDDLKQRLTMSLRKDIHMDDLKETVTELLEVSKLGGKDRFQLFFNTVPEMIKGPATKSSLINDKFLRNWMKYREGEADIRKQFDMTPEEYTDSIFNNKRFYDRNIYWKVLKICNPKFLIRAARRAFETNKESFERAKWNLSDEEFSLLRKTWDFVYRKPLQEFFDNPAVKSVFKNGYDVETLNEWTEEYVEALNEWTEEYVAAFKRLRRGLIPFYSFWIRSSYTKPFIEALFDTLRKTAKRKIAMKYWAVFDKDTFNRAFVDSDIADSLIEEAVAKAEEFFSSNISETKTDLF